MKDQETLRKELSAPLPPEAVKPHPTKSYLSSIKAIYVTERLNTVFGIGKWKLKTDHVETTDKGMVVCKTVLEIPEYDIYYESFGGSDNGGENSKNFDLGDAYKGATTDAITKICSYLEIGIDVFKGLVTAPKQEPKGKQQQPELLPNMEAWPKAVEFVKKGGAIVDIKDKYILSVENEKLLITQSK